MSFQLYHIELNGEGTHYEQIKPVTLSGASGPIARFVRSLGDSGDGVDWLLSGREMVTLVQPTDSADNHRLLFDLDPNHPQRVTLCELVSLSGSSRSDTTHLILGFKTLFAGPAEKPAVQFKLRFTVMHRTPLPRFHESMRLLGGTSGGSWRWSEPELSLGAAVISGFVDLSATTLPTQGP